jgi:hypothetical protein
MLTCSDVDDRTLGPDDRHGAGLSRQHGSERVKEPSLGTELLVFGIHRL